MDSKLGQRNNNKNKREKKKSIAKLSFVPIGFLDEL